MRSKGYGTWFVCMCVCVSVCLSDGLFLRRSRLLCLKEMALLQHGADF